MIFNLLFTFDMIYLKLLSKDSVYQFLLKFKIRLKKQIDPEQKNFNISKKNFFVTLNYIYIFNFDIKIQSKRDLTNWLLIKKNYVNENANVQMNISKLGSKDSQTCS